MSLFRRSPAMFLPAIAAIAFSLGVSGCSSSAPDETPPVLRNAEGGGPDSKACQKFIASLPAEYYRDWVMVPEDPANADSPAIRVFYYGKKVGTSTPVVFFNGGPAANSWSSYQILSKYQAKNADYAALPFVYIDQRGTGCSDPYPHVETTDDLSRLALYGSVGITADAEAVRRKLQGDAPWKVFGQSYGGMVVHRYVEDYPASVVSASSHGFALTDDPFETLSARVESQNKVMTAYLAEYPDDVAELSTLHALSPDNCFTTTDGKHHACGKRLLGPLQEAIGFLDQWPWIHRWLVHMQKNGGVPQDWIDKVVFNPASVSSHDASWADEVIWHNEMNFASNNSDNCAAVFRSLEAKGETPRTWYLNQCQAAVESPSPPSAWMSAVLALPQNLLLPEAFKAGLALYPSLPFYLYSGEVDPYSPPVIFADELRAAGSLLHYTDFAHTGHNGFFDEDVVWRNLLKN